CRSGQDAVLRLIGRLHRDRSSGTVGRVGGHLGLRARAGGDTAGGGVDLPAHPGVLLEEPADAGRVTLERDLLHQPSLRSTGTSMPSRSSPNGDSNTFGAPTTWSSASSTTTTSPRRMSVPARA